MTTTCPPEETFAALLDGELTHNHAGAVREHAQGCAACRAREAHLSRIMAALSRLERPADEAFVQSVAGRLSRPAPRPRAPVIPFALAAAAALAVAIYVARPSSPSGEFTPRGAIAPGAGRHLGFETYVHPRSNPQARRLLRDGDALAPGDGLSFVLYNRSRRESRFLLFALDSQGAVHWFYPAYLAPGTDPTSPVLAASPEVVTLSEGVTPDHPAPGPFLVVAVFAPEELRVQRVETLLAEGSLEALRRRYPDAEVQVLRVQVSP